MRVKDRPCKATPEAYLESQSREQLAAIEIVAMDMRMPFIMAASWHVPNLEEKIAFDRFHVAKLFGDAVDRVRRQENRELVAGGDMRLKGTRHY